MHKKREKKKGYQRNEWNALTCMLSIFPFVYLSVRFFLAEMIIRQRISQWLWHKKYYFWLQKWSSDLKRPYDPKMWTSHIISCQHLVRSNCHRDIVTTLNCHLGELYGLCFRQCLKARAEPKYEIAQTLIFSSFNLPIMVSICREKGTCSYVMTWGVAYQLWRISRDYFSYQYLILISDSHQKELKASKSEKLREKATKPSVWELWSQPQTKPIFVRIVMFRSLKCLTLHLKQLSLLFGTSQRAFWAWKKSLISFHLYIKSSCND